MTRFDNERGFTLVEAMITVAIVGVLASVAIPRLKGYGERVKNVELYENLHVMTKGAVLYWNQYSHLPGQGVKQSQPAPPAMPIPPDELPMVNPPTWFASIAGPNVSAMDYCDTKIPRSTGAYSSFSDDIWKQIGFYPDGELWFAYQFHATSRINTIVYLNPAAPGGSARVGGIRCSGSITDVSQGASSGVFNMMGVIWGLSIPYVDGQGDVAFKGPMVRVCSFAAYTLGLCLDPQYSTPFN